MRRYARIAVVIASAMALLPITVTSQVATPDKKVDVSGKWLFNVTTDAGTGTPTVTLKQTGDSLSGHYSSQTLGEADLKAHWKPRSSNCSEPRCGFHRH